MRKFVALGAIAALALGAQTAAAEGFSYNLIEGSYATGELDTPLGTADLDGFAVKGSWELAPSIFVLGGLQNLDVDGGGSLDSFNLGVGMNWALSDNADVFGAATFEQVDGGTSESGFGVTGGVRGRVGNSLELSAAVKYTDIGDAGDAFTYTAGGRWYFTPNFAVGLDYNRVDLGDFDSDGDLFSVSLRYDFGDR